MQALVSPYHLTTREPAAIAAFLLAERTLTMLPGPFNGTRRHAEELSSRVPSYLGLIQSWSWTVPLWTAGVVGAAAAGADSLDDVRAACARIAGEPRFSPLRALMRPELFESEEHYLDSVARDLLKAGPDPAITVPMAAAMDRFAARHGLVVMRSDPQSIVQRAEEQLGRRAFAVALPVLLQASAERLLAARELLAPELADLRHALAAFVEGAPSLAPEDLAQPQAELALAARAYASAFAESRDDLLAPDEDDELRALDGTIALTGLILPGDAVLTSSVAAVRTLSPAPARIGAAAAPERGTPNLPVPHDPLARDFLTILVRPLGRLVSRRLR
ncbi:MAG: hypothetical protein WD749_03770 [Phycisphaerales bacterium]